MSRFVRALFSTHDETLTPLARYTQANGLLYLAIGTTFYVAPGVGSIAGAPPPAAGEEGLLRIVGISIAIIGWFYVIGGRTNRDSFGLATVVDRLLLPIFLFPLAATGQVDWMTVLPLGILDPLLGLGALAIWSRQS